MPRVADTGAAAGPPPSGADRHPEAPLTARTLPGTVWLMQGSLGPSTACGSGGLIAGGKHTEGM